MKKVKPRGKYIFVRRDDPEGRVSAHGIYSPDTEETEQKAYGTVLAVGSEITDVKEGDRVIFGAFAGETLEEKDGGKKIEYRLLESEYVIAFIED